MYYLTERNYGLFQVDSATTSAYFSAGVRYPSVIRGLPFKESLMARADEAEYQRHVDGRKLSVAEHFALERPHLRALSTERFATEVDLVCRVDTKSRICVRHNFYSVPASHAGSRIRVLLAANQVRAYDGTTLLATHERSPGRGREVLELDHYLEVLKIKAGALAGSSALSATRRCGRFSPTHDRFWAEARRREGGHPRHEGNHRGSAA